MIFLFISFYWGITALQGFPDGSVVKNPSAKVGDMSHGFDPWLGKIPWRRAWKPTPVFLPGESYGKRSLEGYSPQGRKEFDLSEET